MGATLRTLTMICRENDAGLQAHGDADFDTAFRHFTEAIRLAPTRAAYHANRAAAALRLGQHATALQDARSVAKVQLNIIHEPGPYMYGVRWQARSGAGSWQ